MRTRIFAVLSLALLAGCYGNRKPDNDLSDLDLLPERTDTAAAPAFALPGVPLKSEMDKEPDTGARELLDAPPAEPERPAAAVKPEVTPAEDLPGANKPAEAAPAAVPAADPGDLTFHLAAAQKYSARKKYRSAAAEYGAALPFVPAGDTRAVHVLERKGAMLLKAGADPAAETSFRAAIGKAAELKSAGEDLANAYLGLGYCQEKAKKVPEAIDSYRKAMDLSASKRLKARLAKTIGDLQKAP